MPDKIIPSNSVNSVSLQGRKRTQEEIDDATEQAHYEDMENERLKEEEEEKRQVAADSMVKWFFENFEDPQNETPYDNEDGDYVYIWGGPFDANEVISDAFSGEYPEEWIEYAVGEVEGDGTHEWAPLAAGDFYEHPEPNDLDTSSNQKLSVDAVLRNRIFERLDELESKLASLPTTPSSIGHNLPPDDIGLPPYDDFAKDELQEAIGETRLELAKDEPNSEPLTKAETRFRKFGVAVLAWLGRKADLAVDEGIKATVKVTAWAGIGAFLLGLADDLLAFLQLVL